MFVKAEPYRRETNLLGSRIKNWDEFPKYQAGGGIDRRGPNSPLIIVTGSSSSTVRSRFLARRIDVFFSASPLVSHSLGS